MPICPVHSRDMVRVKTGFMLMGKGWDRKRAMYEEYVCPEKGCPLRVRAYFHVIKALKE